MVGLEVWRGGAGGGGDVLVAMLMPDEEGLLTVAMGGEERIIFRF